MSPAGRNLGKQDWNELVLTTVKEIKLERMTFTLRILVLMKDRTNLVNVIVKQ